MTCKLCDRPVHCRGYCQQHYLKQWHSGSEDTRPLPRKTVKDRIREKVEISEDGCWNWTAERRPDGYGLIWKDGGRQRAHRVSYAAFCEPITEEDVICHKCDNRRCVNPEHLFKGTRGDNNRDTSTKQRFPMGTRHHAGKLTDDDVKAIFLMEGSQTEIARKFGVHQATVSDIKNRKARAHVTAGLVVG